MRAQCSVPGLSHTYGIGKGGEAYEPAERGLLQETPWSSERYLSTVLFEGL